ncbi:MAG: hypothetical protein K9J06_10910, partial [Flavobacteriales bacterium]|nr:hypothetical protein [Flavobacteriales bacterium]
FLLEKSDKKVLFIPEGDDFRLELVSSDWLPVIQVNYRKRAAEETGRAEEFRLEEFIAVKGMKAKGNRLTTETVNTIDLLEPIPYEPPVVVRDEGQETGDEGMESSEDDGPEAADDDEDEGGPSSDSGPSTSPPAPKPERKWSPGDNGQLPLF